MNDVLVCHEYFPQKGGGEYVANKLLDMYSCADLKTIYWNPRYWRDTVVEERLKESVINPYLAALIHLLPLKVVTTTISRLTLPSHAEKIDTSGYDDIITSGAWTKGVVTKQNQTHISYIHTPVRFAWDLYQYNCNKRGFWRNLVFRKIASKIREWDYRSAQLPDKLIANSENTKDRINKYYRRNAKVIYPPVDVSDFYSSESKGYFLTLSRLWREKNTVEIIEAFSDLDEELVVAGSGPMENKVSKLSNKLDNVTYLGYLSEEKKKELFSRCEAFVFAARDEDFGLTPVEANAAGKPVIAIKQGGVCESQNKDTAVFFDEAEPKKIRDAVKKYRRLKNRFNRHTLIKNAERFRYERFKEQIKEVVKGVE